MTLNPTTMNIQELRGTIMCVRIHLTIKMTSLHREEIISISRRTDVDPAKIWAQKTRCITTQSSVVLVRNQIGASC